MALINGTAGDDYIYGTDGDDVIDGGAGSDHIDSGAGSDVVHGGEGDDSIRGSGDSSATAVENVQLFGDGGNDDLSVYLTTTRPDTVRLDGGDGNDRIAFNAWYFSQNVALVGGAGNDVIDIIGGGTVTVDAGAGDDRIAFNFADYANSYALTLGDGADLVTVRSGNAPRPGVELAVHITDFAAGAAGDRVFLDNYLLYLKNWDGIANPFASGHLGLIQRGADAVLRIDFTGGGDGFQDFVVFEGVSTAALTAYNLSYAPDGGITPGLPADGTAGADFLLGAGGAELLRGFDGDDQIDGGAGNDRIEGGLGRDSIEGGYGDDIVLGGDGDDRITDSYGGNDQLFGGDGRDLLAVERVAQPGGASLLLDGGAGEDELRYFDQGVRMADSVTLIGGDGNDYFSVTGARAATIDAGSGDDRLYLSNRGTAFTISLGDGTDTIELDSGHATGGSIVVSDYQTGASGDRLDIDSYLSDALTGWDPHTNPYETGYLRLIQRGANAILQIDRNGPGAAGGYADLIVFSNADAASFTTLNLGGYSSILGTDGGERIDGDAGNNSIYGFGGDDILVGNNGDDTLYGGLGADRLEGGEGKDKLDGGAGADILIGGNGDDVYIVDDAGDQVVETSSRYDIYGGGDEVRTSLAVYTLPQNVHRLLGTASTGQTLTGSDGDDTLTGGTGNDILYLLGGTNRGSGGDGDDFIQGGDGADTLFGGRGSDTLHGGGGNDVIYGATGFIADAGRDLLDGGAGDDRLTGSNGDDVLIGGTGNDSLTDDQAGADTMDGGEGDDSFLVARSSNDPATQVTLSGGTGNDSFALILGNAGSFDIDGGEGDDTLRFYMNTARATVTLGPGRDIIAFDDYLPKFDAAAQIVVTDFSVAEDGLDLADFLKVWLTNWDKVANPFDTGHLSLWQSGSDALLRIDRDGPAGPENFVTLLTLRNISPATLSPANLGGFTPHGFDMLGTAGDDHLNGDSGANRIDGLAGDDALGGGGGNDTLDGGEGNDTLSGGDGDDVILGGRGNDVLFGGAGADTLRGGLGDDIYYVDEGGDVVIEAAAEGRDVVYASVSYALGGGSSLEVLSTTSLAGTAAIDLTGNAFVQEIDGNAGANILNGGGGADVLVGLGGDDIYFITDGSEQIVESAGNGWDVAYTTVSHVLGAGISVEALSTTSLAGTAAINLTGNAFAQEIDGNAGANVLNGGGGADVLVGMGGDDVYFITDGSEQIVEAADEGRDVAYTTVSHVLGAGISIEVLSTTSLAGMAAIDLTGNELAQEIYGNAGANVLNGGGGADTLVGGAGDDAYFITDGSERIVEQAGQGRDVAYTTVSHALGAGISVEVLSTTSLAGTTAINLTGNELAQQIYGNAGANVLNGGGGADVLVGGGGDDVYFVTSGSEQIVEAAGEGRDVVYATIGYSLSAGAHIEVLSTASFEGTAAISLTGNELAQEIYGNAGANILDGGAGADYLSGLGGADSFQFTTALGAGNVDLIGDFVSGADGIALDDAVFSGLGLGALGANAFVTGTAAQDADDRIIYDPTTGALYFDADGNGAGAAVQFATLNAHPLVTASDFTVI